MDIFISKFNTTAEYNAQKDSLLKPHVSLTKDNGTVHYDQDPYRGHDFVEIGGMKWATMNIGANSVTDGGLYFQWGDTQGYTASQVGVDKNFTWEDYKYCSGAGTPSSAITKYNATDGKTVLDTSDDAAITNWGGNWRTPTSGEIQTLIDATNQTYTTDYQGSGVSGTVFTDKTDSSRVLFLPAVGTCGGYAPTIGRDGFYWTSSVGSNFTHSYYIFCQRDGRVRCNGINIRFEGLPIRAIFDDPQVDDGPVTPWAD